MAGASLLFDQALKRRKECRIGNCRAFAAANRALASSAQSRDAERHCDAVIAEGFELPTVQGLATGDFKAVLAFFYLTAHGPQGGGDGSSAIGFLNPKLLCIADFNSLLGVESDRSHHRNFIDDRV